MPTTFQIVPTAAVALASAALLFPASAPASGCSASACMPRVGDYQGRSPQGLTTLESLYGPQLITLEVAYRKGSKKVKSKYGNSLEDARTNVRYTCKSKTNPWIESGVIVPSRVKIKADGKARVVVPASGSAGVHTWTFQFKRDSVKGHISGTYPNSEGEICKVSTGFSAKLKR